MPARTKRAHSEVIDLTADSSDVEVDQPQRKAACWRVSMNRPSFGGIWAQTEDEEEDEVDADDIIDLTHEAENGISYVEIGRIGMDVPTDVLDRS
jgi:hypothetical protein